MYSIFVRLGLVTSRHSFFSERKRGLGFQSFVSQRVFGCLFGFLSLDFPLLIYLFSTASTSNPLIFKKLKCTYAHSDLFLRIAALLPFCCALAYLSSFFFFEDLCALSTRSYFIFEGLVWGYGIYFFLFLGFFHFAQIAQPGLPYYVHILFFVLTV